MIFTVHVHHLLFSAGKQSISFEPRNKIMPDQEISVIISNIIPGTIVEFHGVLNPSTTVMKSVTRIEQTPCCTATLTSTELSLFDYFHTGMIKMIIPNGNSSQNVKMVRINRGQK